MRDLSRAAFARRGARSIAAIRFRWRLARAPVETCLVCGSDAARVVDVPERHAQATGPVRRTFPMRICRVCGYVGNPANVRDYRTFQKTEDLPDRPRVGTADHPGREFYMGEMAADILGRDDLDVLVFGAGRSLDNHHLAALPQVRLAAIGDIMRIRDDAEFIDLNEPAPRRFDIVLASEVIEHFTDPRPDFAHLFDYVDPGGLLVCSTNLYDGGDLSTHRYIFRAGHTSYFSARPLERIASAHGYLLDLRVPWCATGYCGKRKRYVLLTRSATVMDAVLGYFATHEYAPSESPTAGVEHAARRAAASTP